MTTSRRTIIIVTCALAAVTFAFVQDRVTAAGARRYAAIQRAAVKGAVGVPVEAVMAPAIRSSVRWGAASGGVVLLVGLGIAARRR